MQCITLNDVISLNFICLFSGRSTSCFSPFLLISLISNNLTLVAVFGSGGSSRYSNLSLTMKCEILLKLVNQKSVLPRRTIIVVKCLDSYIQQMF